MVLDFSVSPTVPVPVWSSGDSPVTTTSSATPPAWSAKSTTAWSWMATGMPRRTAFLNPGNSTSIV